MSNSALLMMIRCDATDFVLNAAQKKEMKRVKKRIYKVLIAYLNALRKRIMLVKRDNGVINLYVLCNKGAIRLCVYDFLQLFQFFSSSPLVFFNGCLFTLYCTCCLLVVNY